MNFNKFAVHACRKSKDPAAVAFSFSRLRTADFFPQKDLPRPCANTVGASELSRSVTGTHSPDVTPNG
jgi:hypothetical protein